MIDKMMSIHYFLDEAAWILSNLLYNPHLEGWNDIIIIGDFYNFSALWEVKKTFFFLFYSVHKNSATIFMSFLFLWIITVKIKLGLSLTKDGPLQRPSWFSPFSNSYFLPMAAWIWLVSENLKILGETLIIFPKKSHFSSLFARENIVKNSIQGYCCSCVVHNRYH